MTEADPAWVRGLARGVGLIAWAMILPVIVAVILMLVPVRLFSPAPLPAPPPVNTAPANATPQAVTTNSATPAQPPNVVTLPAGTTVRPWYFVRDLIDVLSDIAAAVLAGVGLWLVTRPEPGTVNDSSIRLSVFVRYGGLLHLVTYSVYALTNFVVLAIYKPQGVLVTMYGLGAIEAMLAVSLLIMTIALLVHLRRLSHRMDGAVLTIQTGYCIRGLTFGGMAMLVLTFASVLSMGTITGTWMGTVFILLGCFGGVSLFFCSLYVVILMFMYRGAFLRAVVPPDVVAPVPVPLSP